MRSQMRWALKISALDPNPQFEELPGKLVVESGKQIMICQELLNFSHLWLRASLSTEGA